MTLSALKIFAELMLWAVAVGAVLTGASTLYQLFLHKIIVSQVAARKAGPKSKHSTAHPSEVQDGTAVHAERRNAREQSRRHASSQPGTGAHLSSVWPT